MTTRATPLTVAAAMRAMAPTAESTDAEPAAVFDRARWEQALMSSGLHAFVRLTGLTLAHHAPQGVLGEGGIQNPGGLTGATGMPQQRVRQCLRDLEKADLISRPPMESWERREVPRPITLTMPARARTEPPSTGDPS